MLVPYEEQCKIRIAKCPICGKMSELSKVRLVSKLEIIKSYMSSKGIDIAEAQEDLKLDKQKIKFYVCTEHFADVHRLKLELLAKSLTKEMNNFYKSQQYRSAAHVRRRVGEVRRQVNDLKGKKIVWD